MGNLSTIAAVDLGSNSFHLAVGEIVGHRVRRVDRLKERVALAEGLDAERCLDASSRQQAVACLRRFGDRLRGLPPGAVRAAATNTFRAARNGEALRIEAQQALGHPVEIISGAEEARLIYLGVAHSRAPGERRRAVVDVGGGSTEIAAGEGFKTSRCDSLRMGCVTFSQGYFPGGEITDDRLNAARFGARVELETVAARYRELEPTQRPEEWIGSSGTMLAISKLIGHLGEGPGITPVGLARLRKKILDAGHIDELKLEGLSETRRPVLVGGVAIVSAVVDALAIDRIDTCEGALREGLLYELAGRSMGNDPREHTVEALQRRYRVDLRQAARVESTVRHLLSATEDAWELDKELLRRAGVWAARLHEVGLALRHAGYHKHGAYLLENSDLPGFPRREQRLLAALVLCHRRKFRTKAFTSLGDDLARSGRRLAVLLRLACRLHRGRVDDLVPSIKVTVDAKKHRDVIAVELPEGWLAEHPLVRVDLEGEKKRLARGKVKLSFS